MQPGAPAHRQHRQHRRHRQGGSTDDVEVINRITHGERDQFAVLVARYGALAKRTALLYGAGNDADDVVQEAFVAAYRALPRFRTGEPFRPWLVRIVVNRARNASRRVSRARSLLLRASAERQWPVETIQHDGPDASALSRERLQTLLEAMAMLREADREVLALRYLLDLSESETAAALGVAIGTVKSRTSRALRRLRIQLAGHDIEVGP